MTVHLGYALLWRPRCSCDSVWYAFAALQWGSTALHTAARTAHVGIVQALLAAGAKSNVANQVSRARCLCTHGLCRHWRARPTAAPIAYVGGRHSSASAGAVHSQADPPRSVLVQRQHVPTVCFGCMHAAHMPHASCIIAPHR